jgi:hypothetical protein
MRTVSIRNGWWLVAVLITFLLGDICRAAVFEVVEVEEEWSLEIGEPNTDANAPQVAMVMSPYSDLEDDYFLFLLNYRTEPDYGPGGVQIQHWIGDAVEDYQSGSDDSELDHPEEVVRWTQVMKINGNGNVTFEIEDGESSSWGGFGGEGRLRHTIETGLTNLNTYRPQISIVESGIGYAGNRVASLTLQRITWTMSNGQKYELHAPIDIDSDLDPWE